MNYRVTVEFSSKKELDSNNIKKYMKGPGFKFNKNLVFKDFKKIEQEQVEPPQDSNASMVKPLPYDYQLDN